jgi:hypothetical protein
MFLQSCWLNLSSDPFIRIDPLKIVLQKSLKWKILSWTDYPKPVSGFLLESQMDATTLDSSTSCSTKRLLEALSDERKADMLSLMICRFRETTLSIRQGLLKP